MSWSLDSLFFSLYKPPQNKTLKMTSFIDSLKSDSQLNNAKEAPGQWSTIKYLLTINKLTFHTAC